MSVRSVEEIESAITENSDFQNKSMQGKIFNESIANCLNGDDDLVDLSMDFNAKQTQEIKYQSSKNIQNITFILKSETQGGINQYKQESLNLQNFHQQINIMKEDKNEEICRNNKADISKTDCSQGNIGSIEGQNVKVIDSFIEKCKPTLIEQQSQKNDSNFDISRVNESEVMSVITNTRQSQSKIRRQSIENYEKAANIINNALSKSMNRVQRINKHVKDFIYLLKIRTNNRMSLSLQENEHKLLNDQTFFVHYKATDNLVNKYSNKLYNILKIGIQIPLFMPTNIFRVYWDIVLTVYTYLFIYIYSIQTFFAMQDQDSYFIKCYYQYTFMLFLVDILVTFNTAYFKKDVIITNRRQIAWKYLSSSFFLADAVSLATMSSKIIIKNTFLVYNPDNSLSSFLINVLVFFKLECVNQKKKQFSHAFTLKDNQKHIMKLFNQLFLVISVAHIVSLAWQMLGQYENQNGYSVSWIQKYNFGDLAYFQLYIYSMYWSVTTMTTAKEQKDRNQQQENDILQILSNKLRNEITVEINSRLLKNNTIFSANFSSQSLRKLVFIMEEVIVSPNEIIFEKGDCGDQSIYFIESGQIEIYQTPPLIQVPTNQNIKPKTHSLQLISQGNIFGEISFFSGLSRNACARSLNLSTLYKIDRNKFINLIKENQEDFERFKMIEEEIKILQDNTCLHLECYLCKNQGHFANDCPSLHLKFDQQFIILRHNFSLFQQRNKTIKRNKQKEKINARINLHQNMITCKVLKDNIRYCNSKTDIQFQTDKEINNLSSEAEDQLNQDLQTSTEQTSQSSFKRDNSLIYQSDKQIFKSNRTITPTQKDQQHNHNLKRVKSQIQIGKSLNQIRNIRESLNDCQNLDNLEDQHIERQNSMNTKNLSNNESIEPNDILEIFDNQNNFTQPQNQILMNIQKISNSTQSDSSQVSLQELEEKNRNKSNRLTIKNNQINQEENSSNETDEQENFKQNQVSNNDIKKKKKVQQTINFVRPSIDYSLSSGIYNSHINQSMEFVNAQHQINKLDNQTCKNSEEKISSNKITKKLFSNLERNSFQFDSKRNNSETLNSLSKQNGNQEQIINGLIQLGEDQLYKNHDQIFRKSKFTLNSIDVQRLNSQIFVEKSNQKILQKICKILSQQGSNVLNVNDQQPSECKRVSDDIILNNFDAIQNYNKFFPHNNFCNIIEKPNHTIQFNQKRKINSQQPLRHRRQNNIFIMQNSIRKSIFCNQIFQNQQFTLIDYEKFKPSFLSYGVSQKNDTIFPKSYVN
ncbi:hypothetical protein ABPG73_007097 [Tetrahymena malaccensis]